MKHNILFITSDQHQAAVTGCYGNGVIRTPAIDRLAETGVRFTKAYCDSPLCAPSRASFITGTRPCTNGALYHELRRNPEVKPGIWGIDDIETMGTWYRKKGYRTAAIGKLHVHGERPERDLGFDFRKHRYYTYEYQEYIDTVGLERKTTYIGEDRGESRDRYNVSRTPIDMEPRYMQDSLTTETTLRCLEDFKDGPFFIYVGLERPHPSWITEKRFRDMYDPSDMPVPATLWEQKETGKHKFLQRGQQICGDLRDADEDAYRCMVSSYYACITELDENIGRILAKLDELGLRDNTIVVYTTDHGELLGAHTTFQKHCHYEESVRVPLIISHPATLPSGSVCEQPCSLIDLFPTFIEMTGGESRPDTLEGESLVGVMTGDAIDPDRAIFSEFHVGDFHSRMLLKRDYKYIYTQREGDGMEQLYAREGDPFEQVNLAGNPSYDDTRSAMRAETLEGWGHDAGVN